MTPPVDWDHPDYKPPQDEVSSTVELSLRQRRIIVCKSCEHLTPINVCGKCGCFLPFKSYFKIFNCPLNKWPNS